jgi:hypothetical protein
MARFVGIFLVLALIQASLALKCKRCKDADCTSLEDETCISSPAGKEAACLTHIFEDGGTKKKMTEKKCVNRGKDGKYDCIKMQTGEVELTCKTCAEDFCNEKSAASRIIWSSLSVLSVVVALLTRKLM